MAEREGLWDSRPGASPARACCPRPRRRPLAGTSRPAPGTFVLGCSLRSNQTAFVTKGQHGGVPTSGGACLHTERRRDMAGRGPSPQRWGRSGPWRPELPPGGVRHRLSSERHVSVRSASEDCSYFFGPQFPQLENGAKCPRRGCCELADVTCSGQRLTEYTLGRRNWLWASSLRCQETRQLPLTWFTRLLPVRN